MEEKQQIEFWKQRVDDYRGVLEGLYKGEELPEDISDEAKRFAEDKARDLKYTLKEMSLEDREGPKEAVTLESLGLNKGEKAEAKFQELLKKGFDPEEAKDFFSDLPDSDKKEDENKDEKKEEDKGDKKEKDMEKEGEDKEGDKEQDMEKKEGEEGTEDDMKKDEKYGKEKGFMGNHMKGKSDIVRMGSTRQAF